MYYDGLPHVCIGSDLLVAILPWYGVFVWAVCLFSGLFWFVASCGSAWAVVWC